MKHTVSFAAIVTFMFMATTAHGLDPAVKCEAGKLSESAKYGSCVVKAEVGAVKTGNPSVLTQCDQKLQTQLQKLKDKAGPGVCPGDDDVASAVASVQTLIQQAVAPLKGVARGEPVPICGDGVADWLAEECDQADLKDQSCTSLGFGTGTLACGGDCKYDTCGCSATSSVVENGVCHLASSCVMPTICNPGPNFCCVASACAQIGDAILVGQCPKDGQGNTLPNCFNCCYANCS